MKLRNYVLWIKFHDDQNTTNTINMKKRIKQKTAIKEERRQLDINLFHSTNFFLDTLKTTSVFQVFRAY